MEMTEWQRYELRSGWFGMAEKFQPIDALGVALGSYFIYQGVTNRAPKWLTVSLGAIMIYIHATRFFIAPQDKQGLVKLLNAMDVTPAELESIKNALNSPNR